MIRLQTIATSVAAMAALAGGGAAHADDFFLNYEAAGVEYSTASFTTVGITTFDSRISGQAFTTQFHSNGAIVGTYSPVQINAADQYGGAGGVGKYAVAFNDTPFSLHFTTDPVRLPHGVNYFGYWLSALDGGNQVAFYRGGVEVGALSPGDVLARIGTNRNYFSNPNVAFAGRNPSEAYAFINFYDRTGSFDEVRFSQIGGGGYESDNHTVGFYTAVGGTPEPATWALFVVGFGLVGSGVRRRSVAADRRITSPAA